MAVTTNIASITPYRQYFIAPHPDDIALSCFGSICNPQSDPKHSLLVTVFDHSNFAFKPNLNQEQVTRARKKEDESFASHVGCDLLSLDLPDSSVRFEKKLIEYELSPQQDPVYHQVLGLLQQVLEIGFESDALIYIPLANSKHLDHLIARDAVQDLAKRSAGDISCGSRVFYYEDLPYASKMTDSELRSFARQTVSPAAQSLTVDLENKWTQKLKGMSLYATQIEASTIPNIQKHAKRVGRQVGRAERLWYRPKGPTPQQPHVDTVCWISWEACRSLGGCGVVMSAMIGNQVYQSSVRRTVLMGPMYMSQDCIEYDPEETAEDIAHRLDSCILYRTHCDPLFSSVSHNLASILRDIESKHAIELVYMRDNRSDDHIVERMLFNFAGNVMAKGVYSPSLQRFLDLLADELGLRLSMEQIFQRTSLASTELSLSSIRGAHKFDNPSFNIQEKARIDADPGIWNHADDDYVYGLVMAQPVAEATRALVERGESCLLIAQEHFTLPAAYASQLDPRNKSIKTLYYVGEVRTICSLVEGWNEPRPIDASIPGGNFAWDAPIRSLIDLAVTHHTDLGLPESQTFTDFEPLRPLQAIGCHRILEYGWTLDKVVPISPQLYAELLFINDDFSTKQSRSPSCFYHGVRPIPNPIEQRLDCRRRLLAYAKRCWNLEADPRREQDWILLLRIARPVTAKAMYRDMAVVEQLGLCEPKRKFLFVLLTFWKGNSNTCVQGLLREKDRINGSTNVHIRMVNGFSWPDVEELGDPQTHLTRDDLHRAMDVNLCLSSYDSFNLAALEGVSCGNLCVISSSCGAATRVMELSNFENNILLVDYIKEVRDSVRVRAQQDGDRSELALSLFKIPIEVKERIEAEAAVETARRILEALPKDHEEWKTFIDQGMDLAQQMSWDTEISRGFLPIIEDMFGSVSKASVNGF